MKTKIIISVVALSLVLITKSVFAQNESITGIQKKEAQTTTSQVKEEKKSILSELKIKNSTAIYNAIKMGLEKRHATLLKIKAKLDARILKNPMNKDTTKAKEELAKLVVAEKKYQDDMIVLGFKFEELKTSSKPSELIKGLKDSVDVVRQDLNTIKKTIRDAVVALAQAPKLEVTKTE